MRSFLTISLMGAVLALANMAFADPPIKGTPTGRPTLPGTAFDRSFELDGEHELERLCAEKTIKTLPLTSVPTNTIALTQISVHTEAGHYTVLLPLRAPQGEIRSLYWGADTIEEALTFMRLLEGGKITAMKVESYAGEFRKDGVSKTAATTFHDCPIDSVKELLKPCSDCFIVEWVFGSLVD